MSYAEIFFANLAIVFAIGIIEKIWHLNHEISKKIAYEKIENIKPENYELLKKDLEERTGLNINRAIVEDIDFLKDSATVTIYYHNK